MGIIYVLYHNYANIYYIMAQYFQVNKSGISIQYFSDNGDKIKIIDPIDRSQLFRTSVWIPYFEHLYHVISQSGFILSNGT